ncbi:MAG TPA: DUF1501 domain-containing protein [Planctomycetaceae bacterium]|nr:DUF1501 domain-containing protein [Planctomycetaceae bacterium]
MSIRPLHSPFLTRRGMLQAGAAGLLGLNVGDLWQLQAQGESNTGQAPRAKSVIYIFLAGGLSQIDSFDMKPDASEEIRGEFKPISTRTPGVQICEHLPQLAQHSSLWSMCRSVTHSTNIHWPGFHMMNSGRSSLPPGAEMRDGTPPTRHDWPGMAALVNYSISSTNNLPPAIVLTPNRELESASMTPGITAGRMGAKWDPWMIEASRGCGGHGCCPDHCYLFRTAEKFEHTKQPAFTPPRHLTLSDSLDELRFHRRNDLLATLEQQRGDLESRAAVQAMNPFRHRAISLLTSSQTRSSLFDVTAAHAREQDLYGRTQWGWTLLLARRLIESGVSMVQAVLGDYAPWDTHKKNAGLLRDFLLPPFDHALTGLLVDLQQRGLLEDTLVVVASEFGRTPKPQVMKGFPDGRDHWGRLQTALFAGGGVRGGTVVGASDRIGSEPTSEPQRPENVAATIYHALGIPRDTVWFDEALAEAKAQPYQLYHGSPIPGLV